jgi:N4-gp56 family major capsid protein
LKALEPLLYAKQFLPDDNMLVGQGGKTRTFRKRTALTVDEFDEGADVTQVDPDVTYSFIDCTPKNFGGGETIYGNAIAIADFNAINDTKEALADAMARKIDERVMVFGIMAGQLKTKTLDGDGSTVEFALAPTSGYNPGWMKSVKVDTVAIPKGYAAGSPGAGTYAIDYFEKYIKFGTAPTSDTGNIVIKYYEFPIATVKYGEATTVGRLKYIDVRVGVRKVRSAKGKPDTMTITEYQMSDLLNNESGYSGDMFVDSAKYGSREALLNGEIGKLAGCKVISSQAWDEDIAMIFERGKRKGYYVNQIKMKAKIEKLQKKADDVYISVWERSKPVSVFNELTCIVLNCGPSSYSKT